MTLVDNQLDPGLATILLPGDPGWDEHRRTFNLLVDQRPEAIALPADERQVATAVAFARARGWRVAAQATGHNAGPLGDLTGTMLLNTSRLTGVQFDADARRVRVGAGVRWNDVIPRLSELGLAALHGSSPLVGVVGYSLGGGIGWLSRKHGLQSSAITAVELVTAEGDLIRADAVHEADLFWALRGGNGNFGIVTALEFRVFPIAELYAGTMVFPAERSAEVLRAWTAQLPSYPDELTTWVSILHVPPLPEIPEPLRGRSLVVVMAVHLGGEPEGRALLAPLRDLGPELDLFGLQPPAGIADLAMDPADPLPTRSATALLDSLPGEAIDQVVGISAVPGSPVLMTQFRHLGGALSRPAAGGGARDRLAGEVCVFAVSVVPHPDAEAPARAGLAGLLAAVQDGRAGAYPSFVEEPADAAGFWGSDAWQRLRSVKALYDPSDVFRGNHHIPPAN